MTLFLFLVRGAGGIGLDTARLPAPCRSKRLALSQQLS